MAIQRGERIFGRSAASASAAAAAAAAAAAPRPRVFPRFGAAAEIVPVGRLENERNGKNPVRLVEDGQTLNYRFQLSLYKLHWEIGFEGKEKKESKKATEKKNK